MAIFSYINPPRWCPDALPSARGWIHPKTGELLVSVPGGIPMQVKTEKPVIEETVRENVIDENVQSQNVINERVEENVLSETVEKPVIKESAPRKRTSAKKEVKE